MPLAGFRTAVWIIRGCNFQPRFVLQEWGGQIPPAFELKLLKACGREHSTANALAREGLCYLRRPKRRNRGVGALEEIFTPPFRTTLTQVGRDLMGFKSGEVDWIIQIVCPVTFGLALSRRKKRLVVAEKVPRPIPRLSDIGIGIASQNHPAQKKPAHQPWRHAQHTNVHRERQLYSQPARPATQTAQGPLTNLLRSASST